MSGNPPSPGSGVPRAVGVGPRLATASPKSASLLPRTGGSGGSGGSSSNPSQPSSFANPVASAPVLAHDEIIVIPDGDLDDASVGQNSMDAANEARGDAPAAASAASAASAYVTAGRPLPASTALYPGAFRSFCARCFDVAVVYSLPLMWVTSCALQS